MAYVLVGFMGVGKTTIGNLLAQRLNLKFIDIDEQIEHEMNMKIKDIFEQYGEPYFRTLEYNTLKKFINMNIVLATGGGVVENPNNIELLKQNKINIWVDTNINTVYNRVVNDINRPNAMNRSFDGIKDLYFRRRSRYNEIAYISVNNDDELSNCVQEIHNFIIAEEGN
ncbi:shikimate kinase [Macrococcoides canis]|uniref:Shikimate kinase n=1 Tax=Macrococcoides canis TaxID=1855823 RepID=A0AAE6X303_9STAP|nr:shikimate kinase [Macrococcus canis]QCT74972.1 shikimate kinase [Macrococcus canis]QIH78575.1 shikimate kinase [Macrococcus canis]QNR08089.1 AAA family ATPase [Macrococcus canis]